MESEITLSSDKDSSDGCIFLRNSNITEFLELCFQPSTKNETKKILLDFWDKFKVCVQEDEDFCEGDILCIYALDYAYKHKDWSLSAASRSFYVYMKQNNLSPSVTNRNKLINEGSLLTELRRFTNFHYVEGEEILEIAIFMCMFNLNFGLSQFLIKFGLIEFPTEINEKSQRLFGKLVSMFNSRNGENGQGNMQSHPTTLMKLDDFLNSMKQSNISIRRSMLILISICIILEYKAYEKLEMSETLSEESKNIVHFVKGGSFHEFNCLGMFINTTPETHITFRDIASFEEIFLTFLPNETSGFPFEGIARKIFSRTLNNYNPRSLKDLARCKIRASLKSSTTLPAQVYQLPIPVVLQEFLLFGNGEIWENLKSYQKMHYMQLTMSRAVRSEI